MAYNVRLPHHNVVEKWKEEKVIKWLKKVHLEDCIPAFEARHIDGCKLLELTEQKLFTYQDLKIKHRKQIAKCVQECKSQASNAKRIARTIKLKHGSQPDNLDNGSYFSDDSDCWGSDFEEDESGDEVKEDNIIRELNNNTIVQSISDVSDTNSFTSTEDCASQPVKSIPKPPDVPVIAKNINASSGLKFPGSTNSIPRPPIKRPPSQPPPPPVSQPSSQNLNGEPQEDYEIPILTNSSSTPESQDCSLQTVTAKEFSSETYELIEAPDETYEMVDAPSSSVSEKPVLPPRIPFSSGAISPPPPLPQKPKKLKDNFLVQDKPEGVRTFSRPRPTPRAEEEPAVSTGFIGTLMGRRPSNPYVSSPKSHKEENSMSSNLSQVSSDAHSSRSVSPERDGISEAKKAAAATPLLPPRISAFPSDETAQNMATRPLPPVPVAKEEKTLNIQRDLLNCPWFHEMERQEAEDTVRDLGESGSFVVRPSRRAGVDNPYSLTVLHEGKLFHLNIRLRSDQTFALGKEKKKEKTFPNISDLISFHQNEPILLTSRGEPAGKTILSRYPEKKLQQS